MRPWTRVGAMAVAGVVVISLSGAAPALAAGPSNDNQAGARVVSVPGSRTADTTVGATLEATEPLSIGGIQATVWYRVTPATATGILVRVVPGTMVDPCLAAWSHTSFDALIEVATGESALWFQAQAGQAYLLQVGHCWGGPGTFSLSVTPNNDRPTTTAPVASFPVRRVFEGQIPVMVRWQPESAPGVTVYNSIVEYRMDGGPWLSRGVTSMLSTSRTLPSGHVYRFRVKVVDDLKRWSAWAESTDVRPVLFQETSSRATWRGTWHRLEWEWASGGRLRYTRTSGSRVSFVFTGRGVGLVAPTSATRGRVKVYVDGTYQRTVDLAALPRNTVYGTRTIAWSGTWSTTRTRTITVVVLATPGRSRVDVDGFVILR